MSTETRPVSRPAMDRPERLLDEIRQVEHPQAGLQFAGLDAAHVEEIGDEAVEPLGLPVDGRGDVTALVDRPIDLWVHQRARGSADGRQGCAQVVRDRIQQGRLESVAPTRDLDRCRFAQEAIALSAPAIWSAAAARTRVSASSGSPSSLGRLAQIDPNVSSPATIRTRYACMPGSRAVLARGTARGRGPIRPVHRPGGAEAWQRPPVSPTPRVAARLCRPPRPCSCRSSSRRRVIRASARSFVAIAERASRVSRRFAKVKLIQNSACASRSPASAISARSRCCPASRPTTMPTIRSNSRFSHSRGSRTVNVRVGSMNRKSRAGRSRRR